MNGLCLICSHHPVLAIFTAVIFIAWLLTSIDSARGPRRK